MPDQIAKAKCPVRARYKALSGHALRTGSMVRPDIASSGRRPGPWQQPRGADNLLADEGRHDHRVGEIDVLPVRQDETAIASATGPADSSWTRTSMRSLGSTKAF